MSEKNAQNKKCPWRGEDAGYSTLFANLSISESLKNKGISSVLTHNPGDAPGSGKSGTFSASPAQTVSGDYGRIIAKLPLHIREAIRVTPAGCWNWTRRLDDDGYGLTTVNGKGDRSHRAVFKIIRGHNPPLGLDHTCRNRRCCNPDHLEPVTQAVNVQRGALAKINFEIAREIRRMSASGARVVDLARQFNLSQPQVSNIVANRRWVEPARQGLESHPANLSDQAKNADFSGKTGGTSEVSISETVPNKGKIGIESAIQCATASSGGRQP